MFVYFAGKYSKTRLKFAVKSLKDLKRQALIQRCELLESQLYCHIQEIPRENAPQEVFNLLVERLRVCLTNSFKPQNTLDMHL